MSGKFSFSFVRHLNYAQCILSNLSGYAQLGWKQQSGNELGYNRKLGITCLCDMY